MCKKFCLIAIKTWLSRLVHEKILSLLRRWNSVDICRQVVSLLLPWTSNFLFPWIAALTEEAAGYEVASNTPGPSWALFFSSKLCYKSCLDKKLSNMILLLQFITQYFETWSKPVDIFKKIVRVQHIPILMLPLRTQCCVWGTSYLNEKNCPPKYSHIFPQHWNGEGGKLASESCWIIVSKIF